MSALVAQVSMLVFTPGKGGVKSDLCGLFAEGFLGLVLEQTWYL